MLAMTIEMAAFFRSASSDLASRETSRISDRTISLRCATISRKIATIGLPFVGGSSTAALPELYFKGRSLIGSAFLLPPDGSSQDKADDYSGNHRLDGMPSAHTHEVRANIAKTV